MSRNLRASGSSPSRRKVRVKINAKVEKYRVLPCGARQIRPGCSPLYRVYQHGLSIGGNWYSFLTDGGRKWSFKADTVSFEWSFCKLKKFRDIFPETFMAYDSSGREIIRGNSSDQERKRMYGVDPHAAWLVLGDKCCMAPKAGRKDCDPDCILRQNNMKIV